MRQEKKKYLSQYLYQETVINTLTQLEIKNPHKKSEYQSKIFLSVKFREEIENKINLVDDYLLREILIQKYILGKTLEEISYILNYSKRHIERLHIKALDVFKM